MPSQTSVLSTGALARAVGSGLVGGALSVDRHPRLARGLGLAFAAGLGGVAGLAAAGVIKAPGSSEREPASEPASPAMAAGLGVGAFVVTAGVSEVGLRAQRRFEWWAGRVTGHPRVAVGVVTAALSLLAELADRDEPAEVTSGA